MADTKPFNKYPRSSGVLLPITMLHGSYGIGTLGAEAFEFVDFLSNAGFHAWQILPVEHTGESFSPYKCVSAYAGEPMLIDPKELFDIGLITHKELAERSSGMNNDFVDYELVWSKQLQLLRKAFARSGWGVGDTAGSRTGGVAGEPASHPTVTTQVGSFSEFDPFWLDSYTLYMAIKSHFDNKPWFEWPDRDLRAHNAEALKKACKTLKNDICFYEFVQWIFFTQWHKLKEYASGRGVSIIGDMPFYVSEDSADVWSRRRLFNADPDGRFPAVGGAPPDYFTPMGQHWGNPVYNWSLMKKEGYKWWIERIGAAIDRYDYVRIDHFRGFDSYWSIPADAPDARSGKWVNGPGMALFEAVEKSLGADNLRLIAEDLGDTHGNVDKLLKDSGLRGMRVTQFGFLGDEKHLPHNITEDFIAYTGTHDNTTLLAWLYEIAPEDRERSLLYVGFDGDWTVGGPNCAVNKAWIRSLFTCGASLAIVPIQDLLGYGADTRTNTPGTPNGNWRFRIRPGALRQIDSGYYKALIKATLRDNHM